MEWWWRINCLAESSQIIYLPKSCCISNQVELSPCHEYLPKTRVELSFARTEPFSPCFISYLPSIVIFPRDKLFVRRELSPLSRVIFLRVEISLKFLVGNRLSEVIWMRDNSTWEGKFEYDIYRYIFHFFFTKMAKSGPHEFSLKVIYLWKELSFPKNSNLQL